MSTKLSLWCTVIMLGLGQLLLAQVTGTVQDETGYGVPNAEVVVNGDNANAVYTDEDGNFSVDANVGDELQIFADDGSNKTFAIAKQNMGILKLGASTLKTVEVTQSIFSTARISEAGKSTVTGKDIQDIVNTEDINSALKGRKPGVNIVSSDGSPGSQGRMNIRGAVSLNGGVLEPLYVVDGVYMNDMTVINQNDIKSVEVLKDAASLAVYGNRGANGVVIITTDRADKGEERTSFRAGTQIGFSTRQARNYELMNARQKLEYERELTTILNPQTGNPVGFGINRTDAEIDFLSQFNHDWDRDLFHSGSTQSYWFGADKSSKSSVTSYQMGYDANTGIVNGYKGWRRISGGLNNSSDMNDWFRLDFNIQGAYETRDEPRDRYNVQNVFWSAEQYNQYAPLYQMDSYGNLLLDEYGNPSFNLNGLSSFAYPTLDEIYNTDRNVNSLRMFGSVGGLFKLYKGLNFRTSIGLDYSNSKLESFLKPSAFLWNFISGGPGSKTDQTTQTLRTNWRNELSYGKTFKDVHNISFNGGMEYYHFQFYRVSLRSDQFPNDFQNTQNIAGNILQSSFSDRLANTRIGYFGAFNYDFSKKYKFGAYFRRDGTSLAGSDNRWGNFWGVDVQWDVAQESFLRDSKAIDRMNFSVSYGTVGYDDGINYYSNLTSINQTIGYSWNGQAGSGASFSVADPDLGWEVSEKLNIGLQLGLWNKFNITTAYFTDKRKDFIFNENLPTEAGSFNTTLNTGEVKTDGFEIELVYDVLQNKKGWDLSLNWNYTNVKSEIVRMYDEDTLVAANNATSLRHITGLEPYTFWAVRYAGVNPANGDALYYDKEGNVTNEYNVDDAVALEGKNPLPRHYGGFGFTTGYKGFGLNVQFDYLYGSYTDNFRARDLLNPADWQDNRMVEANNFWRNPGDTNVLPRPTSEGYRYTDQFVQESSFMRLRNVALSYTFNSDMLNRTGLNSVRLTLAATNLKTWTNFLGDPDIGDSSTEFSGSTIQRAANVYSYPNLRFINAGIDINF